MLLYFSTECSVLILEAIIMNRKNAKQHILSNALEIFAIKGFEGARIDQIAKQANVPKSLIYYHFKNKDDILETLISNFIDDYTNLIENYMTETSEEKSTNIKNRMEEVYYEFGIKNSDLIRVILIESLKKNNPSLALFKVLDAMIQKENQHNELDNNELNQRRVVEFFTSFIPNYAYLCFADEWTKFFKISRQKFDELYLDAYQQTHGAYHKNKK